MPPTATAVPPTATAVPPTATAVPPTFTPAPPAAAATATSAPIIGPGLDELITPTVGPAAAETPTVQPTDAATATSIPTETPVPATDTPVPPTAVPATETAVPTETATPTLTPQPTETAVPTETVPPTPEPTGTPEPSATTAPTATETATSEPTPEPTATPGFPTQSRTVGEDGDPRQVFATGAFRYTVESALRAPEIPELDLPLVDGVEWVFLVVHVRNWGDASATLNMSDLQLVITGPSFGSQFVALDSSTADLAAFLGFRPVLGSTDVTVIDVRDGGRLALLYAVPPDTEGIELIDATSGIDIGPSLEQSDPITDLGSSPKTPELLRGSVVEVVDGQTILVEVDGFQETVRYLGVTAPTGDACYAEDSAAANAFFVEDTDVYLERENTNRFEDGALARDVWVDNGAGGLLLVAAALASDGAVAAAPVPPDTRYAAWIGTNGRNAQLNGAGLWEVCGEAPTAGVRLLRAPLLPQINRPE